MVIFLYFFTESNILKNILLIIFFTELSFLIIYYIKRRKLYRFIKHPSLNDLFVETHPNLTFVTKPNFVLKVDENLEINKNDKYRQPILKTNSLGYCNGVDGLREPSDSVNKIKIACLGFSTTGNYFNYKSKNISYPILLEEKLNKEFKDKFEVNNFGQGGFNSQDLLISFLIKVIDTKPDVVIIYCGYNDIRSYLTKNIKSDLSNSRLSIENNFWKIRFFSLFNFVPFASINKLVDKFSIENSLVNIIHKEKFNLNISAEKGLKIFKRNIELIINVCNARNIKVILSTFCYNKKLSTKNDYLKIVEKENSIIEEISSDQNVLFIDNAKKISEDEKNFVDGIHFTPEGMEILAENFKNLILKNNNKFNGE